MADASTKAEVLEFIIEHIGQYYEVGLQVNFYKISCGIPSNDPETA
jgi:hypothetical protein